MLTQSDRDAAVAQSRRDRAMLAVVFLLLFFMSYSEDMVAAVLEATGRDTVAMWAVGLVGLDGAALIVATRLKQRIAAAEEPRPRLRPWWWTSCAAVLVLDLFLVLLPEEHPLWIDLVSSVAFALLMGILMMVALNADPLTVVSAARRSATPVDWARARAVIPLVVGTMAAYVAATAFDDFFDLDTVRSLDPELATEVAAMPVAERLGALDTLCQGAVSPAFFQQVVVIIPLLLLAIGIEFNYFRRSLAQPVQRAAAAATAAVMAIGLSLAVSTLPWTDTGCGGVLGHWHEYLTFVLAVHGIATGLATPLWLLVSGEPDNRVGEGAS